MADRPSDRAIVQAFNEALNHKPFATRSTWGEFCRLVQRRAADIDRATPASPPEPTTNPPEIGSKSVVPTAEHWKRAIKERGIENPNVLGWIEQRAREIAQEENHG